MNCILFLNHHTEKGEKKKVSLYNVFLGTEHFLEVYMGAILLYGSLAETLKHKCSEGEHINWSAVMRLHCTWSVQTVVSSTMKL